MQRSIFVQRSSADPSETISYEAFFEVCREQLDGAAQFMHSRLNFLSFYSNQMLPYYCGSHFSKKGNRR